MATLTWTAHCIWLKHSFLASLAMSCPRSLWKASNVSLRDHGLTGRLNAKVSHISYKQIYHKTCPYPRLLMTVAQERKWIIYKTSYESEAKILFIHLFFFIINDKGCGLSSMSRVHCLWAKCSYHDFKFSTDPHTGMGCLIGQVQLFAYLSRAIQMVQIFCISLWTNSKSVDFTLTSWRTFLLIW